jgi:hypothetical protein
LPTSRSTARGSKRTACCGCLRLRRPPSSLSDFGWPGCKSACAVHFSADSWPIEHTIGLQIVEKLSSRSRIFASTPKARQAASRRQKPNPTRCGHDPAGSRSARCRESARNGRGRRRTAGLNVPKPHSQTNDACPNRLLRDLCLPDRLAKKGV